MKKFIFIMTLLGMAFAIETAHAVPVISNGSLTGAVVNNGVPTDWSIIAYSPDTNDVDHNVGGSTPFATTPSSSPDGGTWVGIGDDGESFLEIFGQSVSGFDIGVTYAVSWYQANFGAITGPTYTAADQIGLLVDGSLQGLSNVSDLGPGWSLETVQFTATATTHELSFGLGNLPGYSYLSIDGISISQVSSVPEPSTLALLGLGLVGLGFTRRKKA